MRKKLTKLIKYSYHLAESGYELYARTFGDEYRLVFSGETLLRNDFPLIHHYFIVCDMEYLKERYLGDSCSYIERVSYFDKRRNLHVILKYYD